ncbi:hypothetical protein M3Y94_01027000 [Aphelenchoides besseyi]|nr:hypothetical protein M3Y94_01027000 [Aphelenchoides besseyi]KAI6223869.1 Aspartic protease 10 [Aphelenchoides besseyi]
MEALKVVICFCLVGISTQTYTIQLTNDHDVIYRGKISVGTPPQEFEAIFHTGCTLTRFPVKGCQASGRFPHACDEGKTYDPSASTTSEYWSNFTVTRVNYTHFGAAGREYFDTLTFRDTFTGKERAVPNVEIGAPDRLWGVDHAIVCLANNAIGMSNSTLADLSNRRIFPLVTVALRKCDAGYCENGGAITFDNKDIKNCKPDYHTVPLIEGSFMWRFRLDLITLNGQLLPNTINSIGNPDTGNSYIHFPTSMIRTVASVLKAKKQGFYYTTDCNAKFTFGFEIKKKNYEVTEKHLLLNQQIDGQCVLAIAENTYDKETFILGAAFHRAVCVMYNLHNRRLAFAPTVDQ